MSPSSDGVTCAVRCRGWLHLPLAGLFRKTLLLGDELFLGEDAVSAQLLRLVDPFDVLRVAKHVHRAHVGAVEDNWAGAHQRDRNGVFCLADRAWGRALWGSSRRHCCRRHCRLLPPATMCPPAPKVVSPPGTRGHTHGRRAGQRVQALSAYACTASAQRAAAIPQIMRPLLQLALFYRAPSPL